MTKKKYGLVRQLPDFRDKKLGIERIKLETAVAVDLRTKMPPIYDQGDCNGCTANDIAAAVQYDLMRQHLPVFFPSRLFIYYNERALENSTMSDSGATLRDGMKVINSLGVCPEPQWMYNLNQLYTKPSAIAYRTALLNKSLLYHSVPQTLNAFKSLLMEGYPIICGIAVYDSFESDNALSTGQVSMPGDTESLLGGHAILLVGYNNLNSTFIFRNSWGKDYGAYGYGFIPFSYITNPDLAFDFWVINVMQR